MTKDLKDQRSTRTRKVRAKLRSRSNMPRLIVFRSNKYIYAQIVDDNSSTTVTASSNIKTKTKGKIENAKIVGQNLAKKALEQKIKKVVFDRGGYKYHGRVKALAEGARGGGLEF